MSAILGIFDPRQRYSPEQKETFIHTMQGALAHRAPEGFARHTSTDMALILVHGAHAVGSWQQPVHSEDGKAVLAYDGYICNLDDLGEYNSEKHATARLLYRARSGMVRLLPRLDGGFALAFYENDAPLLLACDLFASKPLYWLEYSNVLVFASELCAMQTLPFFDPTMDAANIAEFLSFQYVGAPRTLYPQVKKIPAGHWLQCRPGSSATLHRYGAFTPGLPRPDKRSLPELAAELEMLLVRSLKRRTAEHGFIAACLSGGVDSSTVAALARAHLNAPVHTFSIGFPDTEDSEHEQARRYAGIIGSTHHERILSPDICEFLLKTGVIMDEPNGDSSCLPTYMLSSVIREHTHMALCGDYADELFGGYGRYSCLLEEGDVSLPIGQRYHNNYMLFFPPSHLETLLGHLPEGYIRHLEGLCGEFNSASWLHPLHRMRRTDMETYTPGAPGPKVERMGMRFGVEFRSPFMSVEIMRFAETLPPEHLMRGRHGKLVLREVAYKYLPREDIDKPKHGFCVPVDTLWEKNILNTGKKLLGGADSRLRDFIGATRMDRFLASQQRNFHIHQVWVLCVLETYIRTKPAVLPEPIGHSGQYAPLVSPSVLEDDILWQNAMQQAGFPVIFYKKYDYCDAHQHAMPRDSLIICATASPSLTSDAIIFDWQRATNWDCLTSVIPDKAVAVFENRELPNTSLREHLKNVGITHVLFQKNNRIFLCPTTGVPTFEQNFRIIPCNHF